LSLEELELRIYQCPISVEREEGSLHASGYSVPGNLKELAKRLERTKIRSFEEDVKFVLRKSLDGSEVYKCPRTGRLTFYDPRNNEEFMLSPHDPIKIKFFTFDKSKAPWNVCKESVMREVGNQYILNRFAKTLKYGAFYGATLGGMGSAIAYLLTFNPLSFLIGFIAFGLMTCAAPSLFEVKKYWTIASNICEDIRNSNDVEIIEHAELVDLYEAIRDGKELNIPRPQSEEFYRVCKEVRRRLSSYRHPWAWRLYDQKVKNWRKGF